MRFPENECRFCEKVFCCTNCRLKHENNAHALKINCDICKYGYLVQKNVNESLFMHIKTCHWPLHCILCKRVFSSIKDLKLHTKCNSVPDVKDDSPKTPFRNPSGGNLGTTEDSPILAEIQLKDKLPFLKLITSTPMQGNEHIKKDFNKNDEAVTPVDHPQPSTSEAPMQVTKRRVTFCEMSIAGNTKNDTPERELEEVKPKVLSEQFSSGSQVSKEHCTPIRSNINDPDQTYSTPARTKESLSTCAKTEQSLNHSEGELMEFSTPAKLNYSVISTNDTTCTTEPEENSQDEFTNEVEEIMSCKATPDDTNDTSHNKGQDKEVIIIDNEKHVTDNAEEITQNSNGEEEVFLDDQPSNIKQETSVHDEQSADNKQEADNNNETHNTEAHKDGSTIWMSALNLSEDLLSDESNREDNTSEKSNNPLSEISNNSPPQIISAPPKVAHPTPILKKYVLKEEILDEDKENITMNSPMRNKILKMHPTPHPILKQRDVNKELLENYENGILPVSKMSPEKSLHSILKKRNDSKELLLETDENVISNTQKDSPERTMHPTPHPKKQREGNKDLLEICENTAPNSPKISPERTTVKVHPTPIIKRTNIHMKFQIPAHFSSTPILNMQQQPKIVKKVLTQQIVLQQGEANFCETSTTEMLGQINQSESISGIGKDTLNTQENTTESQDYNFTDNKSNLWASMTKIVKRVIQKTVSFSNDSFSLRDSDNNQLAIAGSSFKRHYSESDSPEMALAPQVKRFKLTDIKCRRPIRNLSPPRPGRMLALPSTTTSAATFEIVKSVTTQHAVTERKVYVDKATQTDDDLQT